MKNKINVTPLEHIRAASKLSETVLWLENNRAIFIEILKRAQGSPCRDGLLVEMRCLQYEMMQWLSAIRG